MIPHDRLFKEFLHRFLPQFLHLFFPNESAHLDFETLQFLDKELLVNLPEQMLRIPDVVAEVQTLTGETETIIIHVEVEANRKESLSQRMFEYYSLLRLLRQKKVLPIALVLIPNVGGLKWQTYTEELFGQTLLEFRYGQVGLRDLSSEKYIGIENAISSALATLMQATNIHILRSKATKRIVASNLTSGDKIFLIKLLKDYAQNGGRDMLRDWLHGLDEEAYMMLDDLELEYKRDLTRDVTRTMLFRQLKAKFGDLSNETIKIINEIDNNEVLENLMITSATANTLMEFEVHLP